MNETLQERGYLLSSVVRVNDEGNNHFVRVGKTNTNQTEGVSCCPR